MNFLFIAPRFHTNQAHIVETLISKGHRVDFFCATIGPTEDHSLIKPVIINESTFSKLKKKMGLSGDVNNRAYFPSFIKLYIAMERIKPDVVIIRLHGRVFSYMAAVVAKLIGAKVVFYEQALLENIIDKRSLKPFKLINLLRYIKFYFPLWFFNASWITPLGDIAASKKGKYLYYIPFAVKIISDGLLYSSPFKILDIGKFQNRKNHFLLLDVIAKLNNQYKIELTIIGEESNSSHSEYKNKLHDRIVANGLQSVVTVIANIPYENVSDYYKSNHLFVLPATNEPAAISPLEAMGYGLPVLCSDSCGTKCYIDDGINGRIFKSDDAISMTECLDGLIQNRNNYEAIKNKLLIDRLSSISGEAYYSRLRFMLLDRFGLCIDSEK